MAYLSETTISAVIKREGFLNMQEALFYFQTHYPDLVVDKEMLEVYFSCHRARKVINYEDSYFLFQRNLIIISEYLTCLLGQEELVFHLREKYPDMHFNVSIVSSACKMKNLPDTIVSLIESKRNYMRIRNARINKPDFQKPWECNVSYVQNTLVKFLFRNGFTRGQIAFILGVAASRLSYQVKKEACKPLNREEFVQALCKGKKVKKLR